MTTTPCADAEIAEPASPSVGASTASEGGQLGAIGWFALTFAGIALAGALTIQLISPSAPPVSAAQREQIDSLFNQGHALQGQGDYAAAIEQFQRVLALEPGMLAAREGIAGCQSQLLGPEAAGEELQALGEELDALVAMGSVEGYRLRARLLWRAAKIAARSGDSAAEERALTGVIADIGNVLAVAFTPEMVRRRVEARRLLARKLAQAAGRVEDEARATLSRRADAQLSAGLSEIDSALEVRHTPALFLARGRLISELLVLQQADDAVTRKRLYELRRDAIVDLGHATRGAEGSEAYYLRGLLRVQQGHTNDAVDDLKMALKLRPSDSRPHALIGSQRLLQLDHPLLSADDRKALMADAERHLLKAIEGNPDDPIGYQALGRLWERRGAWGKAMKVYAEGITRLPRNGALRMSYVTASLEVLRGMPQAQRARVLQRVAQECQALIKSRPEAPAPRVLLGRACLLAGALGPARKALDSAISLAEGGSAEAYLHRGEVRLLARDLEGARGDLARSLELDAKQGRAYYLRGLLHASEGRVDEAIDDHSLALSRRPDLVEAMMARAALQAAAGQRTRAISDYSEVLERHPKLLLARVRRAELTMAIGRHKAAAADFRLALMQAGTDYRLWLGLARATHAAGDAEAAVEAAYKALGHAPAAQREAVQAELDRYKAGGEKQPEK